MILPIYLYGQPVLKKKAAPVDRDQEDLETLITSMWETMYRAKGVGLAAPQVGHSLRIFVVDTTQLHDDDNDFHGFKQVFINAEKIEEQGDTWEYEEGCLSIPNIRADVERPEKIRLRYYDRDFVEHDTVFTGMNARVIQHEYDHIEGVLFIERVKPIKRKLIRRKLENIRKGITEADYPVRVPRK